MNYALDASENCLHKEHIAHTPNVFRYLSRDGKSSSHEMACVGLAVLKATFESGEYE